MLLLQVKGWHMFETWAFGVGSLLFIRSGSKYWRLKFSNCIISVWTASCSSSFPGRWCEKHRNMQLPFPFAGWSLRPDWLRKAGTVMTEDAEVTNRSGAVLCDMPFKKGRRKMMMQHCKINVLRALCLSCWAWGWQYVCFHFKGNIVLHSIAFSFHNHCTTAYPHRTCRFHSPHEDSPNNCSNVISSNLNWVNNTAK